MSSPNSRNTQHGLIVLDVYVVGPGVWVDTAPCSRVVHGPSPVLTAAVLDMPNMSDASSTAGGILAAT